MRLFWLSSPSLLPTFFQEKIVRAPSSGDSRGNSRNSRGVSLTVTGWDSRGGGKCEFVSLTVTEWDSRGGGKCERVSLPVWMALVPGVSHSLPPFLHSGNWHWRARGPALTTALHCPWNARSLQRGWLEALMLGPAEHPSTPDLLPPGLGPPPVSHPNL